MKKGFTLTELLAVIFILAILALIVSPIISGVISNAQDALYDRSVEGYTKAVQYSLAQYQYSTDGLTPREGSYSIVEFENLYGKVDYQGDSVTDCNIKIDSNGSISVSNCKVNGKYKSNYV